MQIIPAIDVLDGSVVRLKQGQYDQVTTYESDPVLLAKKAEQEGAQCLHLVNLSGARQGGIDPAFLDLISRITSATNLRLQVGGGIRSLEDIQSLIEAGVQRCVIGSLFFTNQDVVRQAVDLYGSERFVIALDQRDGSVQINGWEEDTQVKLEEAIDQVIACGIRQILVTDISRDGMRTGPSLALYCMLVRQYPGLQVTASGGVRNQSDLDALCRAGSRAAVVGTAFLEGDVSLRGRLPVRIIPCLDVKDGRTVKGTSFQNLRDAGDPVELAKIYADQGADELVFLDIAATNESRKTMCDLVSQIADAINIPFTVGGGVQSAVDARMLLSAGADKISINSAAVKDPNLIDKIAATIGSTNLVVAIDVALSWFDSAHHDNADMIDNVSSRAESRDEYWRVLINGGTKGTDLDAIQWAQEAVERGAGELLITSFDRDGTGEGFDCKLLRSIKEKVNVPVIASGGAGSLQDFIDAAELGDADAVLAATVFHYGHLSIKQVKESLLEANTPVRL